MQFTTELPTVQGWYFVNNGDDPPQSNWSIKMLHRDRSSDELGMIIHPNSHAPEHWEPLSSGRFAGWRYMGPIDPAVIMQQAVDAKRYTDLKEHTKLFEHYFAEPYLTFQKMDELVDDMVHQKKSV